MSSNSNIKKATINYDIMMDPKLVTYFVDSVTASRSDLAHADDLFYKAMMTFSRAKGIDLVLSMDTSIDMQMPEKVVIQSREILDNLLKCIHNDIDIVNTYNHNNSSSAPTSPVKNVSSVIGCSAAQLLYGPAPAPSTFVSISTGYQLLYGPAPTAPTPSTSFVTIPQCVYGPAPDPTPTTSFVTIPQCVYGPAPDPTPTTAFVTIPQCVYGPAPMPSSEPIIQTPTSPIVEPGPIEDPGGHVQVLYGPAPTPPTSPVIDVEPPAPEPEPAPITDTNTYTNIGPISMPKFGNENPRVVRMNVNDKGVNSQVNSNNQPTINNQSTVQQQNYVPTQPTSQQQSIMTNQTVGAPIPSPSESVTNSSSSLASSVDITDTDKTSLGGIDINIESLDIPDNNKMTNLKKTSNDEDIPGNNSKISNNTQNIAKNGKTNVSAAAIAGVGALGLAGVAAVGMNASAKKREENIYNQYVDYRNKDDEEEENKNKKESLLDY